MRPPIAAALTILLGIAACGRAAIDLTPRDATPERPSADALALSGEDHNGEQIDLASLVAQKPTVIVFYRGYW